MTAVVLDAAAVVDLLVGNERGRAVRPHLSGADLFSVAHLDAEVLSALARMHRDGQLQDQDVTERLHLLGDLDVDRVPISVGLLEAAWALHDNVSMRDALYVAVAIALDAQLATTDDRLARALGDRVLPIDHRS